MTSTVTHLSVSDLEQAKVDEVLDRSINELRLDTRARNALQRWSNVNTIRDLIRMTPRELLQIKNFGRISLQDVRRALHREGLELAKSPSFPRTPTPVVESVPAEHAELFSPQAKMVSELVKEWESEKAMVLADWCEEHELMAAAEELKLGPSERARAYVEFLAFLFGLVVPPRRLDWELNWLPGSFWERCGVDGCDVYGYRRHIGGGLLTPTAVCVRHISAVPSMHGIPRNKPGDVPLEKHSTGDVYGEFKQNRGAQRSEKNQEKT
jgi:hypothetical protein